MSKKSEDAFIKEAGSRWLTALTVATIHIRSNRRLVGLDNIRAPAIHRAALLALGGEFPSRALAEMAVEADPSFTRFVDGLIAEAAALAKEAVAKANRVSA